MASNTIRTLKQLPRRLIQLSLAWALALPCLLAPWLSAQAQPAQVWNSIGPPGGSVLAIAKNPTPSAVLYAGTAQNGVFMSADSGQTWAQANTGLPATSGSARRSVRALAADGQYLYAATDAGLFYSSAGAALSWQPLAATGSAAPVSILVFDASSGQLFAATTAADPSAAPAVFSMPVPLPGNAPGAAWTASPLPADLLGMGVGALTVVPADVTNPAMLMATAANRVFAAPVVAAGQPLAWVDADPQFMLSPTGLIEALHYSVDFSQVYACSGGQLFIATQLQDPSANTWIAAPLSPTPTTGMTCTAMASGGLAAGGPATVALATSAGVYASSDGTVFGATTALNVSPVANALAIVGGAAPSLIAAGGFGLASQPLTGLTSTSAWNALNGPAVAGAAGRLANATVTDSAVLGTTLYAAVASGQYADVLASNDGGATWVSTGLARTSTDLFEIPALTADSVNRILYAATSNGLYALAAGNWVQVSASNVTAVASLARSTGTLYVGTDSGLFTLALGASPSAATAAAAGFTDMRVSALLVSGGKVYAGVYDFGTALASVSVTTEPASGASVWSDFASGPVGSSRITSLALAGDVLLAATRRNLVSLAAAGGAWTSANNSANTSEWLSDPNGTVVSLLSDGTTVFAATAGNGMFAATIASPLRWMAFNGSGSSALGSLEMGSLRADGSVLYAGSAAGLATLNGIVAGGGGSPAPQPGPAPADSGGGGALNGLALLGLALATVLARAGSSRRRR